MSTRIHICEFGTQFSTSRLLAATAMSESTYGPNDAPHPMSTPTLELKRYRQLLSDVKNLMMGFTNMKGLLIDVIGPRRSQP